MTNHRQTKREKGRPRSARSTEAILEATRAILLETGYSRLSLEAVAARAGTGKATIYRWWPSKGELVLEAAEEAISIGVVPDLGSLRDDLSAAIAQLAETFSRPLASIVIFAAIAVGEDDPGMSKIFREKFVFPWRMSAAEAIRRGIERGELATGTDVQFLLDVIVGTVFQRTLVVSPPKTEELVGGLLALVLPGDAKPSRNRS